MALVERFSRLQADLPDGWQSAQVRLAIPVEGDCARALALLAPANPGRRGKMINFTIARRGDDGLAPDQIRNLLRRLDGERIQGTLALIGTEAGAPAVEQEHRESLAAAWDEELAKLPSDWSDLYAEVELFSSDHIEPGALRLSPLNPTRPDARPVFRFRAARQFGYGASPEMVCRCMERLDEAGISGKLRILQAFSDSYPAKTQGPVWYADGKVI